VFFCIMTSKNITPEKKETVKDLTEKFESAKSVVFVDYAGMDMSSQDDLRNKIREAGGSIFIAKNTLMKIASEKAGLPAESREDSILTGQTAIVFGLDDSVSPIQVLGKFVKENEAPQIKAGVVEGSFQDKDGVIKISKLPNKEQLYAQVVGAVGGPMYGIVGVLNANLQKLVYILKEASEKQAS